MKVNVQFNSSTILMTNNGNDTDTIPYGGNNTLSIAMTLGNAAVVPPPNSYWQITTVSGGALVNPQTCTLTMPPGSTATWTATPN